VLLALQNAEEQLRDRERRRRLRTPVLITALTSSRVSRLRSEPSTPSPSFANLETRVIDDRRWPDGISPTALLSRDCESALDRRVAFATAAELIRLAQPAMVASPPRSPRARFPTDDQGQSKAGLSDPWNAEVRLPGSR
jgi:hypothetical protein